MAVKIIRYYAKPFRDIAWLGQEIDERWQAMKSLQICTRIQLVSRRATQVLSK